MNLKIIRLFGKTFAGEGDKRKAAEGFSACLREH